MYPCAEKGIFPVWLSLLNKSNINNVTHVTGKTKISYIFLLSKWNFFRSIKLCFYFLEWQIFSGPNAKILWQDLLCSVQKKVAQQQHKSKRQKCKNIWNSRAPSSCVLCFCKKKYIPLDSSISLSPHELSYVLFIFIAYVNPRKTKLT